MTNAIKTSNSVAAIIGTLQSDGLTPTLIKINPANGAMKVVDANTGTASTSVNAIKDGNSVAVLMGTSSSDGTTPIPVAVDVSNNLLIKST